MPTPDSVFSLLSPQDAIIAIMIGATLSDETVSTSELLTIERTIFHLPAFRNYDADRIPLLFQAVVELFQEEDGLDAFLGLIKDGLPERMSPTAYLLACDIIAADGRFKIEESRFLEELALALELNTSQTREMLRSTAYRYRALE